jgi:sec-independent protein translocase protein TatA
LYPKFITMTQALILGMLGGLGAPEIIIILVIVLLLFGGKKIPELMKGLGRGMKEFKDAKDGASESTDIEKK